MTEHSHPHPIPRVFTSLLCFPIFSPQYRSLLHSPILTFISHILKTKTLNHNVLYVENKENVFLLIFKTLEKNILIIRFDEGCWIYLNQ